MKKKNSKIIYKRPPHWRILKIFFPDYDPDGTVACACGKKIYSNQEIPADYIAHEETHLKQQCHSYFVAVLWWICYFLSKSFRFTQEREAFCEQYDWIRKNWPWARTRKLQELSERLASPLYGSMISVREAQRELLSYVKKD